MENVWISALVAAGPHPSLGAHADTYDRLIGSWTGELENHMGPGPVLRSSIEVHFGWVLEGRAVQDVWITPARNERSGSAAASLSWYGTTLRLFEPATAAWRTVWSDPVSQYRIELEGRRQGDDIVQLGTREGRPIRWTFSEIRHRSFLWQGHILDPDGSTWRLEVSIRLGRSESAR